MEGGRAIHGLVQLRSSVRISPSPTSGADNGQNSSGVRNVGNTSIIRQIRQGLSCQTYTHERRSKGSTKRLHRTVSIPPRQKSAGSAQQPTVAVLDRLVTVRDILTSKGFA